MSSVHTVSTLHFTFLVWRDFAFAIVAGSLITAAGLLIWLATAPPLPAAFWNPLARHVAYELTVPADSPEAATVLREVKQWLADRGESGDAELRTDADGAWLAVVHRREVQRDLRADVIQPSGVVSTRMRFGASWNWMIRLYQDSEGVRTARPLFPMLFASNGLALLAISLWRDRSRDRGWEAARGSLSARVLWGLLGGCAMVAVVELWGGLLAAAGWQQSEQPVFEALLQLDGSPFALTCAAIVGLGPLAEELFFRRHVFGRLAAAGRSGVGYAVSAVLFGVIHFHPVLLPSYVLAGLCLAWLYSRTRWIGTPLLAHAVNNTVALGVLLGA
ncbi:MAG TPA: type II CAAX endopeptidase family protein [Vicinamibacterales bacterium]|nr:type II CAAX endopeptidase family protein [Vicinamibacterales bacterium]